MTTTTGSTSPPRVDAQQALAIACWIVGTAGLLANVLVVRSTLTGMIATTVCAALLIFAVHGSQNWVMRRALPHFVAAALALVSWLGLCSSSCGSYAYYESFLGMPTALAGALLHLGVAAVCLLHARGVIRWAPAPDFAIPLAIGGSVFFGSVLIAHGSYCGACFAIHCLMLIQAYELLRIGEWARRVALGACIIASAGLANAWYHHQAYPKTASPPDALLAYMRSGWDLPARPSLIQTRAEAMRQPSASTLPAGFESEREREARDRLARILRQDGGTESAQQAAAGESASPAAAARPRPTPRKSTLPDVSKPGSGRPIDQVGLVGRPDAPILLTIFADPQCSFCAQQAMNYNEIMDLVTNGKLAIRLNLTYRDQRGQAAATLIYAAGFSSGENLWKTYQSLMANQGSITKPDDVFAFLPPDFPAETGLALLNSRFEELSQILGDCVQNRAAMGVSKEPTTLLQKVADPSRVRSFSGFTLPEVLRIGVNSLLE